MLDAGDFLFKNQKVASEAGLARARLMLDMYRQMGYAAACVGREDLAAPVDFLQEEAGKKGLKLLSANLRYEGKPLFEPYAIFDVGGNRIAVLGVTSPRLSPDVTAKGVEVLDPETSLKAILPQVEQKAQVVILLSNLGDIADNKLARAVNGIDVIVGSGAIQRRSAIQSLEGTTHILRTDTKGRSVGEATIDIDTRGDVTGMQSRLIPMGKNHPVDEAALARVEELEKRYPVTTATGRPAALGPQENPFLKALEEARKKRAQEGGAAPGVVAPAGRKADGNAPAQPLSNPLLELLRQKQAEQALSGKDGGTSALKPEVKETDPAHSP